MDIKGKLRTALLESKHKKTSHKNEYGCVMAFLTVDEDRWEEMQDLIDDEDLYEPDDDPSYGKESEPHVTILFGLHNDIPDAEVTDKMKKMAKPPLKFSDVTLFKNKMFDVLKFDVESPNLHRLNKVYKEFPHTSSFPKYHPHCTIAYLLPGSGDKYIDKIKKFLDIKVEATSSVYSKADGEKITIEF